MAEEEQLYTIGEWCGIKQYRCRFCPFDVLDDGTCDPEEEIYEHWLHRHFVPTDEQPVAPPRGAILIADKSGREVTPAPAPVITPETPRRKKRPITMMEDTYGDSGPDATSVAGEVPGDAFGGELG